MLLRSSYGWLHMAPTPSLVLILMHFCLPYVTLSFHPQPLDGFFCSAVACSAEFPFVYFQYVAQTQRWSK